MDSIPVIILRIPLNVEILKVWGVPTMDSFEINVWYSESGTMKIKTITAETFQRPDDYGKKEPRF